MGQASEKVLRGTIVDRLFGKSGSLLEVVGGPRCPNRGGGIHHGDFTRRSCLTLEDRADDRSATFGISSLYGVEVL